MSSSPPEPTVRQAAADAGSDVRKWHLWLPVAICVAAFATDFVTPLGIADGFAYVIAVAACLWVRDARFVLYVAAAGTVLLTTGLLLAHLHEFIGSPLALVNRVIGAISIWIVATLVWSNVRVEAALRHSRDRARQASQAKSRFLAVASHDLRQPLQAVVMLSGALARMTNDARVGEIADQQQRTLAGAGELLNTLLDLSKLESGALRPTIGVIDLSALLTRLYEDLADEARRSGVRLSCEPVHLRVRSDAQWLRQILQNLLINAVHHTPAGGQVSVAVRQHADTVEIEITDTGVGIPADKLEHIFDEFYQVERNAGTTKGWGLGLAIVRYAAAMLGHEVTVESEVGRGTTFTVALPAAPESPIAVPAAPESMHGNGSGCRILLIDDDEAVAAATSLWLKTEGFDVAVARGSADVTTYFSDPDFAPDVIISDLHLQEAESGPDIVRQIRRRLGRAVPVIFVSGEIRPETPGVGDFEPMRLMTKPVDTNELLRAMSDFAVPASVVPASGGRHREVLR